MAAKAEDPPAPAAPSDPAAEPPPRGTTAEVFDKLNEKCGSEGKERERGRGRGRDEELEKESREAKRRRTTRQLALEKPPPPGPSGRGSDGTGPEFSFDTRFSTPIETTPKFGSFNLSLDLGGFEIDDDAAAKKEEDEDREDREGKIVI